MGEVGVPRKKRRKRKEEMMYDVFWEGPSGIHIHDSFVVGWEKGRPENVTDDRRG